MITKFYWHIHHDILVEPLTKSIKNRIEFIKENGPKEEMELKLRLLRSVKGSLPEEVIKAWETYIKAWDIYRKAEKAHNKVGKEPYSKTSIVYIKAWKAYDKAGEAYDKALKKHKKEIEQLHKKECPDCPWNGKSIFNYKQEN